MRILLVEDDPIIGDGLNQGLMLENYAVDWAKTMSEAKLASRTNQYNIIILDIGLPDGSGLDVLRDLRHQQDDTPVIILTAYDEKIQKVAGLDAGADDYLVKPFDLDELLARLRALSRRSAGRANPSYTVGDLVLEPASHKVFLDGVDISLGPKEFAILRVLMEKPERVFSKTQIEDSLYGWNMEIESNAIEVHIYGLRRKLGKNVIQTIRHVGYKMSDGSV